MNYLQYMQIPAGPIQQIPDYLQAQTQDYHESKPLDSFLGTDYVHNFIQKHKNIMGFDEEGNPIPGLLADQINKAYINQWKGADEDVTESSYEGTAEYKKYGHTYLKKLYQDAAKYINQAFPNRIGYKKAAKGIDDTKIVTGAIGYLPSQGEFILGTPGVTAQWIMDHSKPTWVN